MMEPQDSCLNLLDSLPSMVWHCDASGQCNYFNRAWLRFVGRTAEQEAGDGWAEGVHPDDREWVLQMHRQAIQAGRPLELEYRLRHHTGEYRWVLNAGSPIIADGVFTGYIGSSIDITERKRAQEQIRLHSARLEEEVQRRATRIQELERQRAETEKLAATGRMAARIAHEINNPLAGIKNSFRLIRGAVPADHPYFGYVARIESEITRIARIVHQMFDLYRPDQESAQTFSLTEAVHDVASMLEPGCRQQQVDIAVEALAQPLIVSLPKGSVSQVLYNVIQNAIEASPVGGSIRIEFARETRGVRISVSDQGDGIPPHLRARVFEPFFSTKTDHARGGLGLGLSVSCSIMQAMGGELTYRGPVGHGAIFDIILPLSCIQVEATNG